LTFPRCLSRDEYRRVRSLGFLWSPTRGGFTRKLASGGAEAVARMLADTFKAEGQGTQEDPRFVTNPVTIESWPTDTRNPASL